MKSLALTIVKDPIQEINELHLDMCGFAKMSVEKAIRIGQLLTEEKAKLKHSEWIPWFQANIKFGLTTANNYRRLYRQKDKFTNVVNLTDAYRLSLPNSRKKTTRKIKPLIIKMFLGSCRIEDPPKNWHVVDDQVQENNQSIVCVKCWTHTTGGERFSKSKQRSWTFECHCSDSTRTIEILPK